MSYGCGQDQTTPSDTHTRSVMLTQFLGSLIPNFILDGSFISFEWLKQLPVAMAMARPHPIWLIMLTLVLGDHTPKFCLIGLCLIFKARLLPVGVAMTKLHPLPCPHVFNNAHLGSRKVYTKFQLFGLSV